MMNSSPQLVCPLCGDNVSKLLFRFHVENERLVIERIKEEHPGWAENDGICSRCVDYYHTEIIIEQRVLPEIGPHFPVKTPDDFVVLPTGLRLDADPRFTGKGVTICFIDSGFIDHPDLTAHKNRILKTFDITSDKTELPGAESRKENVNFWHGTMTSVVCAGDGTLSNGLYKGIASDASLVLIKVQDKNGRISNEHIVQAMRWVLDHHREYGIRVVNMSIGTDEATPHLESEVDQLAEALVAAGINVVAAVGNDPSAPIKPPANAVHAIAVGGLDDNNELGETVTLYHSPYGRTGEAVMKPEVLAHAIWIAAPILPDSEEAREAASLFELLQSANVNEETDKIKSAVTARIRERKFISPHYMHVDGTSFAAPIVSAVIAQLLEINPSLSPTDIRRLIFGTAKRLAQFPAQLQGYGMVQPRKAMLQVMKRTLMEQRQDSPYINREKKLIEFTVQNTCATQLSLVGSFNGWTPDVLLMEPYQAGLWRISIPLLPAGKYHYKYLADETVWMEDTDNPYREPDGISGFNSVLFIEK